MASLTPTGLETITYGQQGWNAIVTANMQRLNAWLGKMLPLMDNRSRTEGAVPMVERRQRQLGAVQARYSPYNGTGGPQVPRGGRWRQRRKGSLPPRASSRYAEFFQ